jgi:O-antigen/teichoic acid export membrane protein
LVKEILSYGIVEGLSKGLNKLVILLLPLLLTSNLFGKIGILLSLELLLPVLLLLGLERSVLRFQSDPALNAKLLSTVTVVITILHAIVLLLLVGFYFSGFSYFTGLNLFPDLFLLILLIYLQGLILINLNKFRVESRHKEYFSYRLIYQGIKIFAIIFLTLIYKDQTSYLVGGIFSSLIILILIFYKSNLRNQFSFDKKVFVVLISYSWPFIFHGFAGNILGTFDRFVIVSNLSLEDVAQYTFAYTLGSAVVFSFVGLSVYMEPLVYKEHDTRKRENILKKYLIYALCVGLIFTITIIMAANFLIPMFYGTSYEESLKYLPLIAIAHMFVPFYTICNYKLAYEKKTKSIAFLSVICSLFNIGINIWLVPIIGVNGAVIATLISYFFMAIFFTFKIRDSRPIFKMNLIFIILLAALSVIVYFKIELSVYLLLCLLTVSLFIFYRFHFKTLKR